MKNPFESIPNQGPESEVKFTKEERIKARKKHPDPRSIIRGPIEEMPGRIRNKIDHKLGDSNQDWLENRAEIMADRSGINEAIKDFDSEEIKIVDIGGGKGHIMREVIESNPDKEIKTAEIDLSDYASKKVSESEEGEKMDSVFGNVKNMPIKDNSVELATAYFTFQELSDKEQKEVLEKMVEIIEDDGKIIIVDEPPKEGNQKEGIVARAKNIFRNLKVSKFNLHDGEYWRNLFEENELKIVDKKEFRDDDKEISDENPAQFFSYILEKIEKKAE